MKIVLTAECFNTIMKTCKPFVSKDRRRPIFTQIELTCNGETVTAVALDGYSLVKLTMSCENGSDSGKMIVPVMKPVGKGIVEVYLSDTDKEIMVDTRESKQTFRKVEGEFLDHTHVFPPDNPKDVFWFDPKRLATALSVFTHGWVKIEAFDRSKNTIFVLSDTTTKQALVLPLHKPD